MSDFGTSPSVSTPADGAGSGDGPTGSNSAKWLIAVAAVVVFALVGAVVLLVTGGSDSADDIDTESRDTISQDDNAADDRPDDGETAPVPDPGEETSPDDTRPGDTSPDDQDEPPADEPSSGDLLAGAPDGVTGTRESPVPSGQFADLGNGWRLQIVDVIDDDTDRLVDGSFLPPPPAGSAYTTVTVRLGYYGLDDPASGYDLLLSGVGASSVELDDSCAFGVRSIQGVVDIFSGGVATGELCFTTTPDDAAVLQIYADDYLGNEVFLDASTADPGAPALPTFSGPQPGAAATPARLDPTPIGTPADLGDGWTLTVVGPVVDITDQILAENSFNVPEPGERFVGFPVDVLYEGAERGSMFDLQINALPDNNVSGYPFCGSFEGELDRFADVFTGGRLTGVVCAAVTEEELSSVVAYAMAGFDGERVFFSLGGAGGGSTPTP
jgi:hypothetical protein